MPAARLPQGLHASLSTMITCRLVIVIIIILTMIIIIIIVINNIITTIILQAKIADLPESVDWRDQGVVTMVIIRMIVPIIVIRMIVVIMSLYAG